MVIEDALAHLWEAIFPVHLDWIQVEVSAYCNAWCPYCVLACYEDQWQGGLMDIATFARIEPSFTLANMVFLQGWGEPLLHPRFWDMVSRVKATGTKVGFTTNGTLLGTQSLHRILNSNVELVGVSLAGADPTTHDRFRKGCRFSDVERALVELKELKQERQAQQPDVRLAFMLLKSNRHQLPQLADLAAEWGVSQVVVSNLTLIAAPEMQEESTLCHPDIWPEINALLGQLRRRAESRGVQLHYYGPGIGIPQPVCTENVLRSCFVSHRGDVSPCVMTNLSLLPGAQVDTYFRGQPYAAEPLVFGNIREHSLPDIWNSKRARAFRAAYERRFVGSRVRITDLPAPCRRCYKLVEQGAGADH